MKTIWKKLLPPYFVKTHRSFLVNLHKVDKVEKHQVIVLGKSVPVSTSYYDYLLEKLKP